MLPGSPLYTMDTVRGEGWVIEIAVGGSDFRSTTEENGGTVTFPEYVVPLTSTYVEAKGATFGVGVELYSNRMKSSELTAATPATLN